MIYKLTRTGHIVRLADGASIPEDPANTDRKGYEQWLSGGGVPQPADAPSEPGPAEQIRQLEQETLLPRPVRDVLLGLMEKEAATLGVTPTQLRVVNPGYRRVKELDEQIAALRSLL